MKQLTHVKFMLTAVVFLLSAVAAQAGELRTVAGIGLDFGGEKLNSVKYANGETKYTNVNSGLSIYQGALILIGDYETQATLGYKISGVDKHDSPIWRALPVELLQFYRSSNLRMGLGLTYHFFPRLESNVNGDSSNGKIDYDNSRGYIAQIGWEPPSKKFSINLRYTSIKFVESNVLNAPEVSGNVTGINFNIIF